MKSIIPILSIFFILEFVIFGIPIALAQEQTIFYFGNTSINYNSNEDPFLQWRVLKGAEIYTGRSYDISGAIGTSDYVAHWSDWKVEDTNCNPDTIIPVRYIQTNGAVDPSNYFISPSAFPTGNYFTWDGCRAWSAIVKSPDGSLSTQTNMRQAPNENRFAFSVKAPKKVTVPIDAISSPAPYILPPFAISKSVIKTENPKSVIPVNPTGPAPWYIQWWWAELIIAGLVAFVLNEELDIL